MSQLTIRNSLSDALGALGIPTAYENAGFKPDGLPEFFAQYFDPVDSISCGKTIASSDNETGIFRVSVFIPNNSATFDNRQLELIDSIKKVFYNGAVIDNVNINEVTINSTTIDGGFFRRDVNINYFSFEPRQLGRYFVQQNGIDNYGEIPAFPATNLEIEFDLLVDANASNTVLWMGSVDNRLGVSTNSTYTAISAYFNATFYPADNTLTVGAWHSVKLTYNGVIGTMSVDGVPVISESIFDLYSPGLISLCTWEFASGYFKGVISNLSMKNLDNQAENRFYPMDTLNLKDTLGNGSTDGVWFNAPSLVFLAQ